MNKTQLIDAVAESVGLSKMDAQRSVDAMLNIITKSLIAGDPVALLGFGIFDVKVRKARKGRNPRSGEVIEIPAAKVPSFKVGKALKDAINK